MALSVVLSLDIFGLFFLKVDAIVKFADVTLSFSHLASLSLFFFFSKTTTLIKNYTHFLSQVSGAYLCVSVFGKTKCFPWILFRDVAQ